MAVLLVIIGIVLVIVLFLLILQRHEIKSISKQLDEMLSHESNELVHSGSGGISDSLINRINELLKKMRRSEILYNKKSHSLDQMLTNISHDLRTPLTSAMGYINMLNSSGMPCEEKERIIRVVRQRMQRLEELINSFFEFSKIISSNYKPEIEPLNLIEVLQESIVHYYDDFCAQKREICFESSITKIKINSSRYMLMRIFDNLISNALKHGEGNLTVTVTETDKICIGFRNKPTSYDIDIERVFDEFYTTDISRTKGHTGLGLAIARQFTELLGGGISAEYEEEMFLIKIIIYINS